MSDKNKFGYADKLSSHGAAETLESLARALREGRVTLRGAGQAISLVPSDTVKMKIEADAGNTSGKVTFSISWKPEYARAAGKLSAIPTPGTVVPVEPDDTKIEAIAPVDTTAAPSQDATPTTTEPGTEDDAADRITETPDAEARHARSASKPARARSSRSSQRPTRRKRTGET